MKFMLMRKADSETEQGILPTDELFKAMLEYNDRMIQAGVFLFGNGLRPTSEGCRIVLRNGRPEVLRGTFTPPGEQLAGYSVLEVDSLEQAIERARQWPTLDSNGNAVLELRRYFEPGGFRPRSAGGGTPAAAEDAGGGQYPSRFSRHLPRGHDLLSPDHRRHPGSPDHLRRDSGCRRGTAGGSRPDHPRLAQHPRPAADGCGHGWRMPAGRPGNLHPPGIR